VDSRLYLKNNQIYFYVEYREKERVRALPAVRWNKAERMWSCAMPDHKIFKKIFPEYEKALDDMIKREYSEDRLKSIEGLSSDIDIDTSKFKRKPYKHQIDIIKKCLLRKKFALLCEMGTGKTQAIINVFQILKEDKKVDRMLIVCPKTVIGSWEREIRDNSEYQFASLIGTKKQRLQMLSYCCEIFIINYEGLLTIKDYDKWDRFDIVVLDESSKIKNHQAQRSKLIVKLFSGISYKFILTGTPITQSPLDIFQQFKFLNPEFLYHQNFYAFRNTYAIMGGYGKYQIIGYKNLDDLKARISRHSIQIKKEDCLDLPAKIYESRELDMPTELAAQYKQMKDELMIQVSEDKFITASIVLTKIIRLQQILSGVYLKDKNEKLDALFDIVEDNSGEQIVIWCRFIETLHTIEKGIVEKNIPYSILYGAIKNRDEQIENFQSKRTKIFLAQINTGGLGITLTAGNIVIYYENTFSLEDRLQSEDRCHRIGQKKNVVYIDLLYKNTIDEKIFKAIISKQDIAHMLVSCFKGLDI